MSSIHFFKQISLLLLLHALSVTARTGEYHVSVAGNDAHAGSESEPLKTISAAALRAQPGDVITVHEGVYRERVNPPRGGLSDVARIVYQAAPGEKVMVKGSEVVTGWERVKNDTWKVTVPDGLFGDFNPYRDVIRGDWFNSKGRVHHTGAVYLNGHWLTEAARMEDVLGAAGDQPLWFAGYVQPTTTIWAQFKGIDPNEVGVEINVRQSVFYPDQPGRNYVTVRGFTLEHAATPWAPPTAEQVGLIGTHWSKGWIIESNVVRYSTCVGVTLGKHGDRWDNTSANSAEGYVKTIERGLANGWSKDNIGHHIVRNNTIAHCEQAGIVGSLGPAFSKVTGNVIHDIHVRRLFSGAEMAGIKFHGAIDTEISGNHIYRSNRGIWLDWMAQGTRVTRNLLHDNGPSEDLFAEVNHGPFLVDNNILLSPQALLVNSQGGAYAHNLMAGSVRVIHGEKRQTPYHPAHSTEVAALHGNPSGDDRFYNNLMVDRTSLMPYDTAGLPVFMAGNVFLAGAKPSAHEPNPIVLPDFNPIMRMVGQADGYHLEIALDRDLTRGQVRKLVTTDLLGRAKIPNLPYEQPDGSPYRLETDYFGNNRNVVNPFPGPFEPAADGKQTLKVWPSERHSPDSHPVDGAASPSPKPQRPVITKKGTIDQDLCETTPFVFRGGVFRLEWFRNGSILRIMEHDSGRELSRFGANHRFPCAYVEGDTVYVVGTKETAGWCGNVLTMFTSKDLMNWTERTAFTIDDNNICNTSLCKAGGRYVMSIEVTKPGGFPARFIESKDLLNWTLMAPEHKHELGRYNAAHCLRWHDGWFYLFYLEAGKPRGYEQYITRSRDLIQWESSTLNPVLAASAEDKQIANPRLTPEQRDHIAKAADVNNSDIDFCEFNGRLIINYSWGNQGGTEFIAEAEYAGTVPQFLQSWFPEPAVSIVCPTNASPRVKLAAKEVRRYAYLRTGVLLPIADSATAETISFNTDSSLAEQQYRLRSDGKSLVISGGSDLGVLYGAYAFIEKMGVRFYLHGDSIPDDKISFELPVIDETREPLFALRGLQPFHDFPEGPDWWTREDWLAFVSQAAKMRMNFIGLHTYPFKNKTLGPEPTVWIGLPDDVNGDGTVRTSDAASWYTTAKFQPYGCYAPAKTSTYSFGGAAVFPTDDYGSELNGPEDFPFPKTPAANLALINGAGAMLRDVFTEARRLGMTTCVGTESPLDIPDNVIAQLVRAGLDPAAPTTLKRLYAGMFTRIQRAYPIDYYWIWGHEGEIDPAEFLTNLRCAHAALKETQAPFELGICGWGWITGNFPALNEALPKDVVFSAINMSVGNARVSPNFNALGDRQRWAIPWFEDDGGMTSPQLWVGRMRKDAADALRYGCNGLMGLHWRTRILGPNIAALARAAWDQSDWNNPAASADEADTGTVAGSRFMPVADFYADWTRTEFGPDVAQQAAAIFAKLDGHVPRASGWSKGPGVVAINRQPWAQVSPQHAFVDALTALRPHVRGAGNLERFDWWLNTLRFNRAMARLGCARGALDGLMERISKEPDADTRERLAGEQAMPRRRELVGLLGAMYGYLMATLHNASELGTIANIEQQSMLRTKLINIHDAQLEKVLGEPLPDDVQPWRDYRGPAKLVVLTARGSQRVGEALPLRIIALDRQPVKSVVVRIRRLGVGEWTTIPATHLARALYEVNLPAAREDFEYYVEALTVAGHQLVWPATATMLNQTVVIQE